MTNKTLITVCKETFGKTAVMGFKKCKTAAAKFLNVIGQKGGIDDIISRLI